VIVDDQDADVDLPSSASGNSMQNSVPGRAERRPIDP